LLLLLFLIVVDAVLSPAAPLDERNCCPGADAGCANNVLDATMEADAAIPLVLVTRSDSNKTTTSMLAAQRRLGTARFRFSANPEVIAVLSGALRDVVVVVVAAAAAATVTVVVFVASLLIVGCWWWCKPDAVVPTTIITQYYYVLRALLLSTRD